jgi:hypothetical protein
MIDCGLWNRLRMHQMQVGTRAFVLALLIAAPAAAHGQDAAGGLLPIPDAAAISRAEGEIRQLYEKEYADAWPLRQREPLAVGQ